MKLVEATWEGRPGGAGGSRAGPGGVQGSRLDTKKSEKRSGLDCYDFVHVKPITQLHPGLCRRFQ